MEAKDYKINFGFKDEKDLQNYLDSLESLNEERRKKSLEDIIKFGYVENINSDKKKIK